MRAKPPPFDYDYAVTRWEYRDGALYWRAKLGDDIETGRWNARYAGRPAGSVNPSTGYVETSLNHRRLLVHRIIYLLHHKEWPDICDHIDHDPLNNDINNLRSVTPSGNSKNIRGHGTTGHKHIYPKANGRGFKVEIQDPEARRKWYVGFSLELAGAIALRDAWLDIIQLDYAYTGHLDDPGEPQSVKRRSAPSVRASA